MSTAFRRQAMMLATSGPPATWRGNAYDGYSVLHFESGWLLKVVGSAMNFGGVVEVSQQPSTTSAGLLRRTFSICEALEVSALTALTHLTIAAQLASLCAGPRHMTWLSAVPLACRMRSRTAK